MPLTIPPQLKRISQFVRRAEELDSDRTRPDSRVVAYYCRQHAVQSAMSQSSTSLSADSKTCLGVLLDDLEREKDAMNAFTRTECKYVCRRFADDVFVKANKEEKGGHVGKNTARALYAAATFYDILGQFYEEMEGEEKSEEEEEEGKRRVYCKWKATKILKAVKEGREYVSPTAGDGDEYEKEGEKEEEIVDNYHDTKEEGTEVNIDMGVHDILPSYPPITDTGRQSPSVSFHTSVNLPPPITPPPSYNSNPLPAANHVPPTPVPPPSAPMDTQSGMLSVFGFKMSSTNKNVSKDNIQDAMELTNFAVAALKSNDVDLAVDRLKAALKCLVH